MNKNQVYEYIATLKPYVRKLFKLGDNMNTKTARELAENRIEFMKKFVDEFLKAWNANY